MMAAGAGDGGDVPLLDADLGVDSDLAADETPKKKKQNTGSGSKKAKDAADAELECFLCEQAGDLDKEFRTEVVHSCCLNAIRCHLRMLKTVENKADDHLLFKDKLPEWRAMILPLVVVGDAHRTRKMVARHAAGVETKLFREEASEQSFVYLTKRRFKTFHKFWDGYGSESASESFDRRHDETDSDYADEKGETCVKVAESAKSTSRTGRKLTTRSGSRRDAAAAPGRNRSGSDGNEDRSGRDRSGSVRSGSVRPGRSAEDGNGPRSSSSKDAAGDSGSSRRRSDAERSEPAAMPKNSAVEFMKSKAELKKTLETAVAQSALKSSNGSKLKAAFQKLSSEQRSELTKSGSAEGVLNDLGKLVSRLKEHRDELRDACRSTFLDIMAKSHQTIVDLDKTKNEALRLYEASSYLLGQETEVLRKGKMAVRYQRTKLASKLAAGGFGVVFSKLVAEKVLDCSSDVLADLDKVDFKTVMLFSPDSIVGKKFAEGVSDFQSKSVAKVEDKMASLKSYLKANSKKGGGLVKIDQGNAVANPSEFITGMSPCDGIHNPGAAAWLVGATRSAFRYGPGAWPLPGVGSFAALAADSGQGPAALLVLPMEPLIEAGMVALADLPKFLETTTGNGLATEIMTVVQMTHGQAAWLPYGSCVLPLALEEPDTTAKTASEPACWWTLQVLNSELAKQTPASTWAPIVKLNVDHLQRLSGQSIWAERMVTFKELQALRS